jgi:hypothetical protein
LAACGGDATSNVAENTQVEAESAGGEHHGGYSANDFEELAKYAAILGRPGTASLI